MSKPQSIIWSPSRQNLPNLIAKLEALDFNLGWVITVKLRKEKRSNEQNSRLWKLYTSIGNHVGYTPDEMHDLFGRKYLRYQIEVLGEVIEKVRSTTDLDTAEMADYQTKIEAFAATELGWSDFE
jgi:hypothetical protein